MEETFIMKIGTFKNYVEKRRVGLHVVGERPLT